MSNILEYKGYHSTVSFSDEDGMLIGSVIGIKDSLNFHGFSIPEIEQSFHDCIDGYLEMCHQIDQEMETINLKELDSKRRPPMMSPFLALTDSTEIVHSEMRPDGTVKVYVEKPDEKDCFHHATCILPGYTWQDIFGFDSSDISRYEDIIRSNFGAGTYFC